jgi:SAM-dependent methyltransferase
VSSSLAADTGGTYDPAYFRQLFAVEDRHFWFRSRNAVIGAAMRRVAAGLPDGYRVLEVGCGTGTVLRTLAHACARGDVFGMDLFMEGLSFARRRTDCALIQADIHAPPFAAPFDVIGMFDVLEHLPDDVGVLRSVRRILPTGGYLLATVPAHPALWSYFDEASHHRRRYTAASLADCLRASGFEVEYLSPYMAALLPVLWLVRRVAGRLVPGDPRADARAAAELRIVPGLNAFLSCLLRPEARRVAGRRAMRHGTSLLVIARKAGE